MTNVISANENNDDLMYLKMLDKDISLSHKLSSDTNAKVLNEQGMMESKFATIASVKDKKEIKVPTDESSNSVKESEKSKILLRQV